MNKIILCGICSMIFVQLSFAQESYLTSNYLGIAPSILVEPYDTINAIEINCMPIVYEFRIGKENNLSFQLRPVLNYRIYRISSGFSQIGGSLVFTKYYPSSYFAKFRLTPLLGVFSTYAYNRLDRIQTITLGIEPGIYFNISNKFSTSLNLQPGINLYPDEKSKNFVNTKNGFKTHFGIIFHIGYNFKNS